jgi:hypothetical protein
VILYGTCRDCGNLMEITHDTQHVHPFCAPMGPPSSPPSKLDAALWYVSLGWPVFPLLPGGKRPATRNGFKDATTDAGEITRWWSEEPNRNIGLPTGVRFDVIDIDVPEGLDTLRELSKRDTFVHGWVDTASGGTHLYIKPTGEPNSARWESGVDYRGQGGYVVAPPSVAKGTWRWKHLPSPVITGRGDTFGASCE